MTLMSVLLPEPFSPARQCTSPGITSKETPFSAWTPPKVTLTSLSDRRGRGAAAAPGTAVAMSYPLSLASRWAGRPPARPGAVAAPGAALPAPLLEAHVGELVHRILVDGNELVDDEVVAFGRDLAQALDLHAGLDLG